MAHIDTLKVYEEYRAAGFDDKTAKDLTKILENSFVTTTKEWVMELRNDFASQKMVTVLGGIIVTLLIGVIGLLWNNNLDLQILKTCGVTMHAATIKQETK